MLVSNQILISNRNETYSKSAFGSQMVILLKILSLDFFFNKKPRMPRWLYVSCYFRMGCVPSQKITFATSNVWVDATFTISKSSSFCSNFLSRFLWDMRIDWKVLLKMMYIKLIEKNCLLGTLSSEIGYFINIAYNSLTFKISD